MKKILVAIDKSRMSQEALKRAILIAKERNAQLNIIHIIESSFLRPVLIRPIDEETLKRNITEQIEIFTKESKLDYVLYVDTGSPSSLITRKAKKLKVELLVVGVNNKNDISSNYFGSTTLKLIQKTHIPVLVVKNETKHAYKKILAPTNLTDYSKESILFARTLFKKAALKYLHAYIAINDLMALAYCTSAEHQGQYNKELLTEAAIALEKFAKDVPEGETAVLGCDASVNEDLLEYIKNDEADLLVLGSKGIGNLNSFLFGSTASYLVRNSTTDVIAYVPEITKTKSEKKSTKEEVETEKEEIKSKLSPVQKDLDSRKEEIMDDVETFFVDNLKFTNWNVPEAKNQEIAEGLMAILAEKLNEIDQKVKEGKYREK